MNVELLALKREHIAKIPQYTASWIRPEVFDLTIFSCAGYTDYLLYLENLPARMRPNILIGAYLGDELLGFAEWRRLENAMFLNNLFVQPGCRGTGVGRILVDFGIRLASEEKLSSVALDAFDWAPDTIGWYERLGFIQVMRQFYLTCPNPYSVISRESAAVSLPSERSGDAWLQNDSGFILEDYPQAEASQERFGFSSFRVKIGGGSVVVGRLGDRWFRFTTNTSRIDAGLLQSLALLDDNRSLLILSQQTDAENGLEPIPVCGSVRLQLNR